MKPKIAKRSLSNKHSQQRSFPTQTQTKRTSTPHDYDRIPLSNNTVNVDTETTQSHAQTSCLKPSAVLKTEKLLKRDLLRCSNQRPSLLGLQTLQPPRIHHGSQPIHSLVPTALNHATAKRHGSLSDNPQTLQATIDRIGPWPDISINYIRSEGNDLLQTSKNFRNTKNSYLFSPKYYSTLNDHHTKFKFHPSKRSYIEDYRKQKGYLLSSRSMPHPISLSTSSLERIQYLEDDQISVYDASSGATGSNTARDRTEFSTTNLSVQSRGISKSVDDLPDHIDNNHASSHPHLPTISLRNNQHLRTNRPGLQQPLALPAINSTSFQYLNSINSIEPSYDNRKKLSIHNQSKVYFIDGRQQKSDHEVTPRTQGYFGFRATGSPIIPETERSAAVVIYQLARRT
ncbi:hypothetical protein I4U23_019523 [Adineta vaga]|nr:hypothetical protein I4U23_019523 [Adineta vaga]